MKKSLIQVMSREIVSIPLVFSTIMGWSNLRKKN